MSVRGEKPGSRKLNWDGKGLTGEVTFITDNWGDVDPALAPTLPHIGDAWSVGLPYLICIDAQMTEGNINECYYVARYSTDRQLGDEFCEASWDWDLETIDRTKGYTWETAGSPVTIDIPTVEPVASYTITVKRVAPPDGLLDDYLGTLNDRKFHGCDTETLRFDGCGTNESYDTAGSLISVRTVFKFTKVQRSHNYVWRDPLQLRDVDGNLVYYQNEDASKPGYTATASLVSQPVYVSGTRGAAGWDKPKSGADYRYDTADFSTVLSLPKKIGDDP